MFGSTTRHVVDNVEDAEIGVQEGKTRLGAKTLFLLFIYKLINFLCVVYYLCIFIIYVKRRLIFVLSGRAAIQAFVCTGRPFSFYDQLGRVVPEQLRTFCADRPHHVRSAFFSRETTASRCALASPARSTVAHRLVQVSTEHATPPVGERA